MPWGSWGGTLPGPAGGGYPARSSWGGGTLPGPARGVPWPRGGTLVRYPPPSQVRMGGRGATLPGGGYPGRTTEGVLTTRRAVCLLRSRRRTFLFILFLFISSRNVLFHQHQEINTSMSGIQVTVFSPMHVTFTQEDFLVHFIFIYFLQECAFPSTPRDKYFNEWYTSDCIFTNARHVVRNIAVLIEETIPPPCPPPTNTSSRGEESSSLMSMFHPAPIAISGIEGL